MNKGRITIIGLSYDDIYSMPCAELFDEYEVCFPNNVNDIFALDQDFVIINPSAICEQERNLITEYYTDMIGVFTEMVFWIGFPKPPFRIRAKFHCYEYIGMLSYALPQKMEKRFAERTGNKA